MEGEEGSARTGAACLGLTAVVARRRLPHRLSIYATAARAVTHCPGWGRVPYVESIPS